jgi:peptidoglycan-associated lipoprotein
MKRLRFLCLLYLIAGLAFSLACAKRTLYTDATPYTPTAEERRSPEGQVPSITDSKSGTSRGPATPLGREKRIQEESIREEDLRAKALKEEALRKEAALKEKESALSDLKLETVYFDYNQWVIRDDQKEIMTRNAEKLKANPHWKILLEGNCDERGTAEYNLALGQKRAEAAKAFLVGLGLDPARLKTISYGFERPVDPRHNEEAWAKNRRVDFVIMK